MSLPDSFAPSLKGKAKQLFRYLTSGWRFKLLNGLLLLATFAILGKILYDEWDTITTFEWEIRPGWLLLGIVLLLVDLLMGAHIWHLLVTRFTQFDRPGKNIKFWWYANLAKRLPGPMWYIANRTLLYTQHQVSKRQISTLGGLELALILVSGLLTAAITLPFWVIPGETAATLANAWYLFLIIVPCLLIIHPTFLKWVWGKLNPHMVTLDLRWQDTAVWVTYYIGIWSVGGLVLFCLVNSVIPLAVPHLLPVIGMWAIANTISMAGSMTFFGMGLREVSLIFLLSQLLPPPISLILTIGIRIFWLLGELITALLSLLL